MLKPTDFQKSVHIDSKTSESSFQGQKPSTLNQLKQKLFESRFNHNRDTRILTSEIITLKTSIKNINQSHCDNLDNKNNTIHNQITEITTLKTENFSLKQTNQTLETELTNLRIKSAHNSDNIKISERQKSHDLVVWLQKQLEEANSELKIVRNKWETVIGENVELKAVISEYEVRSEYQNSMVEVETPEMTPVKADVQSRFSKQLAVDELVEELKDLKSIISGSEANSQV